MCLMVKPIIVFFCEVFKTYDRLKPTGKIEAIKKIIGEILTVNNNEFEALDDMLGNLIGRKRLRDYGMTEAEIEGFTDSVIRNQQRLLANNYVELSRDDIESIYRRLY